jgi:hypothetical protein
VKKYALYCGLLALAGAAFFVGEAEGSGWKVVASYPAPAPNARSVALFAPYYISVLCDGSPPRIYNLGEPSKYIKLAVPKGAWGLSTLWWGSDVLTVSNYNNSYIYKLTTTGSVLSSFRCPKDHPADLSGSYFDKYVAIPAENLALEITTTGSIVSSFRGPGTRLTALEACYPYGGVVGDPVTRRVYFLARFGTAVLTAPVGTCASVRTGEPPYDDVWVVDAATNYVYLFVWRGSEPVAPASLGRVKALFR